MADSQRLLVLKRLTTLLESTVLTPIDGITLPSTLAGLVFRGRALFGEDSPKTMLSIVEAPRYVTGRFSADDQNRQDDWVLLIQGRCPDDKLNPSDPAYSMLEDVESCLDAVNKVGAGGYPIDTVNYLLGPSPDGDGYLVTKFQPGSPVVSPPRDNVTSKAFFYLPVQVGFVRIG